MADRLQRDEINDVSARYVVFPGVLRAFETTPRQPIIIELDLDFPTGRRGAAGRVASKLRMLARTDPELRFDAEGSRHHVFASLTRDQLNALLEMNGRGRARAIYKIWPDRELQPFLDRSVRTIKGDACLRSFGSDGAGIVWAIADSGIDGQHPHFEEHKNLDAPGDGVSSGQGARASKDERLRHMDFTGGDQPLVDLYGHGTHVAGIIAGVTPARYLQADPTQTLAFKVVRERDEQDVVSYGVVGCIRAFQGVSPKTKLLSLKVLKDNGKGRESALLSALDHVARTNDDGRWLRIHGLNLSLGYPFDAEWFAAGHSPLCVAVNRLVKQGVIVVVAAGNDGSAMIQPELAASSRRVGLDQSISDPGNAELAITVGSTHGDQPHTYGVSYFSSRGPTADGRDKPDLVAPGERIVSCASSGALDRLREDEGFADHKQSNVAGAVYYREESGTSMAAPHVSGAIAAFLSVRGEFLGQPERVKDIFLRSATDLGRRRDFQGAGLIDLMRAMQSV